MRADLDIPPQIREQPQHSRQLKQLAPTLRWLAERNAKITVCGHQGQLGATPDDEAFERTVQALRAMYPKVAVAPNLAADDGPEPNADLLERLVAGQELFVNDDFQWSSAPLTSVVGPATLLPSAAGRQLEKDTMLLTPLLTNPDRPFVVVLGSRDTIDRLPHLYSLVLRADVVLVGGQMSVPFLEAVGEQPSQREQSEFLEECRHAYGVGHEISHPVLLPSDLVWEQPDGGLATVPQDVTVEGTVMDIGPRAARTYAEEVRGAGTVLWAGSLGRVEDPRFAEGTLSVARALASSTGTTILGGDALLALLGAHHLLPPDASLVSATGSAVAFLKDGDLVGLAALRRGAGRGSA